MSRVAARWPGSGDRGTALLLMATLITVLISGSLLSVAALAASGNRNAQTDTSRTSIEFLAVDGALQSQINRMTLDPTIGVVGTECPPFLITINDVDLVVTCVVNDTTEKFRNATFTATRADKALAAARVEMPVTTPVKPSDVIVQYWRTQPAS